MKLRILAKQDLIKLITMKNSIESMRQAFMELDQGNTIMPLRTTIPILAANGMSLFMPAYLPEVNQLGIKVAATFPDNVERDIPAINASILLLDAESGIPKALLEGSFLTAMRTGAVSGLATDLFAKNAATTCAIIGSGVQAHTQLEAVLTVRNSMTTVFIYSRTHAHAQKFANFVKGKYPHLIVTVCDSCDEACAEADIICTATNSAEPFIYRDDVKADCHINAIGSHTAEMREIDTSILIEAKIIVDQKAAALAEAGEIITAIKDDVITEENLLELGYVLNHSSHFEKYQSELTLFKSVGLAIQDIAIATLALELAEKNNIGTLVDF